MFKEVLYLGDLKKDINRVNNPFCMRKEVIKYVGAASVAMLFTPVIILVPHLFDFLYIKDNLRNILLVDFVVIPSMLFSPSQSQNT